VGSSTVYPFATVVAETFGKSTSFKTPKVESTGSGGGLKLFCGGIGVRHPDIANASRRIKQSEVRRCVANGVEEIIEVKIGYDGIVVANSKSSPRANLSLKNLYLALAKDIPSPDGEKQMIANPYQKWSDIDPSLPDAKIEVLGPPPTSGTRDAFVELAMEGGCKQFDWVQNLKKKYRKFHKAACHTVREDGAYIEVGENDNLIVQKLEANPDAFGIFGYSLLEQNEDRVQGATIDGQEPTYEIIADQRYPVSRPLYLYVKKAHAGVIPGMAQFLDEFTGEAAWGEDGYLADKGMIPMPTQERQQFRTAATELVSLDPNAF